MNNHNIALNSPIKSNGLSPNPVFLQNPRVIHAISPTALHKKSNSPIFSSKGIEVSVPKNQPNLPSFRKNSVDSEKSTNLGVKEIDVATIGNLCVDIVLNVPQLPPDTFEERKAYMGRLAKSPPDKSVHP